MATTEEVATLTEQLAALRTQLDALRNGQGGEAARTPVVRVVVPREKKLRRYDGGRDDKALEDWIADAQRTVIAQQLSDQDAVNFLYDHLEGVARDEIRLRPGNEWDKPDSFYTILRDVFGEKLTKTQLLQRFFSRKQRDQEHIQDFSHALMSMAEHIGKAFPGAMDNKDQNLRDTFIENLRDPMLRRDLKRIVREHPTKTFNDVREEARRTLEELDRPTRQPSAREVTVNAECNQVNSDPVGKAIQDLADGQKALINMIAKLTEKLSQPSPVSVHHPNNQRRCFNCNEMEHIKLRCPKLKEQKREQPTMKKVASNSTSPGQ